MDLETFACTTTATGLVFPDPKVRARFKARAIELRGQACEITLEAELVKASDAQRRWWFGKFIPPVANKAGYDREERHFYHLQMLQECFGTHDKQGVPIPNKTSWTQLSVREAWELMEWGVRMAAKYHGMTIEFPSELTAAVQAAIAEEEGTPA